MLPNPVNSNFNILRSQRLFLRLIYLGATASLCCLLIFALIDTPPTSGGECGFLKETLWLNSETYSSSTAKTRENNPQNQEGSQLVISTNTSTLSSSRTDPKLVAARKTLFSVRKRTEKSNNGTRSSHPPKIWPGHQDVGRKLLISPGKGYFGSDVYYPWKNDEQCKHFHVHFAEKNTFKPRALVSFPGSGNSWLRYLIENASGYFTGSVYGDMLLFNSGLLGELRPPNDGTTIVQKTHHNLFDSTHWSKQMFGYRGILVIRNPYEALVSYRNLRKTESKDVHTGIANENEFSGKEWEAFVLKHIQVWSSLIMSWIENSQDYLVVLYEDVKKSPRAELTRILEYLNQPVDKARLDCLMKQKNLEGPFHRAHHLKERKTSSSHIPLPLDSIPSTTPTMTSQQDAKIHVERQARKLDLIIQENIDRINRFFQHKSIPVQLHYSPKPSTIPYFLHTTYINATTTPTSSIFYL